MKKIILLTNIHLVEVDENFNFNSDEYQKLELKINKKVKANNDFIIDRSHVAKWVQGSIELINPKETNCGRCARCGAWTTDYEKAEPVSGLAIGASIDDELFCDECLPLEHKLAF